MQSRTADCYCISGGRSYRILYPDEESDFTVPFGWELDKEESMIYTVTHQGWKLYRDALKPSNSSLIVVQVYMQRMLTNAVVHFV